MTSHSQNKLPPVLSPAPNEVGGGDALESKIELSPHVEPAPSSDCGRRVIEIDNIPFPYLTLGRGPTILMLHLPVNPMHVYAKTIPALAERHQVIVVDFRPAVALWYYEGHGSLLRFVTDLVVKFLNRLATPPTDVVASFMAGGVAMAMAIRHPELIRRLVLISSLGLTTRPRSSVFGLIFWLMNMPGVRWLFHLFMTNRTFQRTVLAFDKKLFGKRRVAEFFFETPQEGIDYHLRQLYDGLAEPPNPFAFETFINVIQYLRYNEIRHLIPIIDHPTLLLFGEEDVLIPPKTAHRYHAALRNSTLQLVPRSRVFLHWEAADSVNRSILDFLGAVEPAPAVR
jgi:pimeloyl-ACP methyl ester carboxylesterase